MPRPKLTTTLKRYQAELQRSAKWRDQEDLDDLWRRMIDLYKGRHYEGLDERDRMVVNIAFANKNTIAPSVAVNNPKFVVNARRPDGAAQAVVTEEVLNYLWRVNKYKNQFRLAVDDSLIVGHGWVKVGYKFVKPKEIKPVASEEEHEEIEPGVDDREDREGASESEKRVADDRPFCERISVFDMYVDPDGRNPDELRWIAQRIRRPVADVKVDSRYESAIRAKAQSTAADRWLKEDANGARTDAYKEDNGVSAGFVDVYEFYDLREGTVCTFLANNEDGFLIKPKPIPYSFGHPFVMIRNYEVPDEFYPMGELEAIEILQHELNATRTDMMNHRKKFSRKWLYDESRFDSKGVQALRSDRDNEMVPVISANGEPITNAVAPMPASITPPEFYNQSTLIMQDMDRVSATSDYMRGAGGDIRRTATEAAMIQDAQNARAADKLAKIEEALAEIGERLIALAQQYMEGEHVIRIVGLTAMPTWVTYNKDYIAGQFDFEVEAGSTQPNNESFRRQAALQLVDAMAPFIQMGVVDPAAVARRVLKEGFGVKDPSMFLMQQGGMPMQPQQGMPPGMPAGGPPMAPPAEAESPIDGIPPELVNRLDIAPSPALTQ